MEDGPGDDSVEDKQNMSKNTQKMNITEDVQLRSMMKMIDNVPKLPMTYRVSPDSCTVIIADVEYLPS